MAARALFYAGALLALLSLGALACSQGAAGVGGFGDHFTYGDGGAYQGTVSVVSVAVEASSAASTSAVTSVTSSASGFSCPDTGPGEPNDTIAQAYALGEISDNDADGGQVKGVISSPTDVDWYAYHGVDLFGNVVDPTRQLLGAGLRTCKYIQCDNGEQNVFTCPSGTTADMVSGHPGCCWTDGSVVTIDLTCGSTALDSDNATIFIRVDNPSQLVCQAYTLQYHY